VYVLAILTKALLKISQINGNARVFVEKSFGISEESLYILAGINRHANVEASYNLEVLHVFFFIGCHHGIPGIMCLHIRGITKWISAKRSALHCFVALLLADAADVGRLVRAISSTVTHFLADAASTSERAFNLRVGTIGLVMSA
jgi:hypothetical protein